MASVILMVSGGMGAGLANSYVAFLVLLFVGGVGQLGCFQTSFILGVENVGKEHRVLCGIVIEFFFVLGEALVALVAYLTRDWRKILLYVMGPSFVFLLYWPFLPESIRCDGSIL